MKISLTGIILLASTLAAFGQLENDALPKIKAESDKNSQVMKIVSYLSDVYGPRLMGTPNYYNSILWTEAELKKWGIEKIEQQSFDNGHRGWEVVNFKMELVQPTYSSMTVYPLAYTSSTNGEVMGEVIYLPNLDTLYALSGQLTNKIVLLGSFYEPVRNVSRPFFTKIDSGDIKKCRKQSRSK